MKPLRIVLIAIELLVALNAVGGGIYGLGGAKDVPAQWLQGSPFTSYFWPSLILLVGVGGSMALAAVLMVVRPRIGAYASLGAGLVLAGWIGVQVAIIGYVSWLQPAMAVAAVAVVALAVAARV